MSDICFFPLINIPYYCYYCVEITFQPIEKTSKKNYYGDKRVWN